MSARQIHYLIFYWQDGPGPGPGDSRVTGAVFLTKPPTVRTL